MVVGLVVSILAFYSDNPSSNPAGYLNFLYKKTKINENKAGVGPSSSIILRRVSVWYLTWVTFLHWPISTWPTFLIQRMCNWAKCTAALKRAFDDNSPANFLTNNIYNFNLRGQNFILAFLRRNHQFFRTRQKFEKPKSVSRKDSSSRVCRRNFYFFRKTVKNKIVFSNRFFRKCISNRKTEHLRRWVTTWHRSTITKM